MALLDVLMGRHDVVQRVAPVNHGFKLLVFDLPGQPDNIGLAFDGDAHGDALPG